MEVLDNLLENDFCFSMVECKVVSIRQKRWLLACQTCKRECKSSTGLFGYCQNCRSNVRCTDRFLFEAEVMDQTGALEVGLSSNEMKGFMNISCEEYSEQSKQERECFLELCAYQSLAVRLRS